MGARLNFAKPGGVQGSMRLDTTRDALRAVLLVAAFAAASACGPTADPPKPSPDSLPDLGDEKIRETLVDSEVSEVPEEKGAAKSISWRFLPDEPREVTVVDRQMDGEKATVLVDVKTRTTPRSRSPLVLSGRLRLHYELRRMVFLRKWQIVDIDNLSMTYREEPKPDDEDRPPDSPPPPAEPPTGSS
jgi:hypothetical protein